MFVLVVPIAVQGFGDNRCDRRTPFGKLAPMNIGEKILVICAVITAIAAGAIVPEVRKLFGLDPASPRLTKTRRMLIIGLMVLFGAVVIGIVAAIPGEQDQATKNPNDGATSQMKVVAPPSVVPGGEMPSQAKATDNVLTSDSVCQFYGSGSDDKHPWKKIERCQIPTPDFLDKEYRQGDFQCCDGGGLANATTADVPPGLELRTGGKEAWSVDSLKFDGSHFSLTTACTTPYSFAPCAVTVRVVAHYRNRPAPKQ